MRLAEIGILPDIDMLQKSLVWSKAFVMTEEFNSHEALRRIYGSDYAVVYPAG